MKTQFKVVVYRNGLPKKNKSQEKIDALTKFCRGVEANNDVAMLHEGNNIVDCDVAVILGWVHENSKNSPHLQLRRNVIDAQLSQGRRVVVIDSNLFLYKDINNSQHYLRYSFDGVFPNTGIYCDDNPTSTRWAELSKNLNLELRPYRTNGDHILLCLQRQGGWSMGGIDVSYWVFNTIKKIRENSQRPIVIRAHPGDKTIYDFADTKKYFAGIQISDPKTTLLDDLKNCWAVVNHNSSPAVAAAIEGYPVFITDPIRSQCAEIANTQLTDIEHPTLFDRQNWVNRLAMFHYNFTELEQGVCWRHMRRYV
jgi:hypothetical protein